MTESDKISVQYAFTVTLKPKRWFTHTAEEQYDGTSTPLADHLNSIGHEFLLVAELTKGFNVHFHGIITFGMSKRVNYMKKFVDSFRNSTEFGFVNIKQIDDLPGWVEYMKKSLHETNISISRRPIIKDDFHFYDTDITDNYGCQW